MEEPMQSIVYGLYFVLPHLEIFDVRDLIVHNWSVIRWDVFAAGLAYAAVYAAIFLALARLRFAKAVI